jgi:hypothetical protein
MAQAAPAASAGPAAAGARTPYRVTLHQIETCNCNHGCGCQFAGFPDHGGCEFLIGFKIIEGGFGDVALAGAKGVIVCLYPGAIHQGNGNVALFLDRGLRKEQVEALATLLSGQAGGMPWEALAGTIAKFTGPVLEDIEMTVNGTKSSFRIPGVLEVRQTPLKDAVSGEEKEVHITYPKGGFMWNDGSVCTTSAMEVDFGGIRFRHPGMYGCYAQTRWTNQ